MNLESKLEAARRMARLLGARKGDPRLAEIGWDGVGGWCGSAVIAVRNDLRPVKRPEHDPATVPSRPDSGRVANTLTGWAGTTLDHALVSPGDGLLLRSNGRDLHVCLFMTLGGAMTIADVALEPSDWPTVRACVTDVVEQDRYRDPKARDIFARMVTNGFLFNGDVGWAVTLKQIRDQYARGYTFTTWDGNGPRGTSGFTERGKRQQSAPYEVVAVISWHGALRAAVAGAAQPSIPSGPVVVPTDGQIDNASGDGEPLVSQSAEELFVRRFRGCTCK